MSARQADLERQEKLELLGRLQYIMDEKGFRPFRPLMMEDSIEDIRYEVFRAKRELDKKRNVKMMQKGVITLSAVCEKVHEYWNPLHLKLEGYSKSMLLSVRDFDEIFEELHWKWCDSISMPVEMKLLVGFLISIWVFHMNNNALDKRLGETSESPPHNSPPTAPTTGAQPRVPAAQPSMSGPGKKAPMGMPGGLPGGLPNMMAGLNMLQTVLGAVGQNY